MKILFWKFVTGKNFSPGNFGRLLYEPGTTVEAPDADLDHNIQCGKGIHCIAFTPECLTSENIAFGPKVAILEVEKQDVIYYEKNGKCRVKKAKVIEVKAPEDWMITGNGSIGWCLEMAAATQRFYPEHLEIIKYNEYLLENYIYWVWDLYLSQKHKNAIVDAIINSRNKNLINDFIRDYFSKTSSKEISLLSNLIKREGISKQQKDRFLEILENIETNRQNYDRLIRACVD